MYDRKKIIDALKYCAYGERNCDGCPVGKDCKGMTNKAMTLAIELLEMEKHKEQPRIMTDLEVLRWSKLPDRERTPIVVEYKDKGIEWICTSNAILITMMIHSELIRFWTDMPNVNQQNEAKWDD